MVAPTIAPPTITRSGLTLEVLPEGAYVVGVAPGPVAAMGGIKPGMIIIGANAVPLAGMGEAMLRVVDAAGGSAALTIAGGGIIRLLGS